MAEEIESTDAIGDNAHRVELADVVDQVDANAVEAQALSSALRGAMTEALSRPGEDQVTGQADGQQAIVGQEKDAFLAGVDTPQQRAAKDANADELDDVSSKLKSLYVDMTNWQVAWSIAQRTQTNVSSLIKGQ